MRTFAFLISICLLYTPLFAQEVEFDIPTEIDIIQGQLSVVFHDGVGKEEALQIIKRLGYDTLEVNFSPITISGELKKPATEKVIQKIRANKTVLAFNQYHKQNQLYDTYNDPSNNPPSYITITVTFEPGTTPQKAQKLLKKYVKPLSINVHSLPNEVIIHVGSKDEEALEQLQANRHIKWVGYIGSVGDL